MVDWRAVLAAARAARAGGDLPRAIALARQATEVAPTVPAPLFLLCALLLRAGDAGANALLPRLERFAGHAPGWVDLGAALLELGQPGAAAVAFTRAVTADAALLPARLGLAAAQVASARFAEAAATYAAAEALAPDRADIPWRRAQCLREAGDPDAAEAALDRAVSRDPAHANSWFSLGTLRQDRRDHAAAAAAYRAACAARPDWHEAAFNLGIALQETGDMDAALAAYGAAWRLRPEALSRIAQALTTAPHGALWLDLDGLRAALGAGGA